MKACKPIVDESGVAIYAALLDRATQERLLEAVLGIVERAPLFVPTMPRTGRPMSVRMTNCGPLGWLTSKDEGYRYQATHPETGKHWPPIPDEIVEVWRQVSDCPDPPEACLINWYAPDAKLGLHVDSDEETFEAPVVSVSLGDDAWFRIGGLKRRDPTRRIKLHSGDVVVMGGPARLIHHGVDRILPGTSSLIAEPGRFNLTLRRVTAT
jgi:alkylated DNA repair protein (DNA oxidative demethylase)